MLALVTALLVGGCGSRRLDSDEAEAARNSPIGSVLVSYGYKPRALAKLEYGGQPMWRFVREPGFCHGDELCEQLKAGAAPWGGLEWHCVRT